MTRSLSGYIRLLKTSSQGRIDLCTPVNIRVIYLKPAILCSYIGFPCFIRYIIPGKWIALDITREQRIIITTLDHDPVINDSGNQEISRDNGGIISCSRLCHGYCALSLPLATTATCTTRPCYL